MTESNVASKTDTGSGFEKIVGKSKLLKNLKIGGKLTIGFGILVALTLLVIGLSYIGSSNAAANIDRTEDLRMPVALASAGAQSNLLRMLAATRGYLALGDAQFIVAYDQAEAAFEDDLKELRRLSDRMDPVNQARLIELEGLFEQWKVLPQPLFALRDDRFEREPAYKILATDGTRYGGEVLIRTQQMIDAQALRDASQENIELLSDMAGFQASFAAMLAGLRNYVQTQNSILRQEYEVNLESNQFAWERLIDQKERGLLTNEQEELFEVINQNREAFVQLPQEEIYPILEGDRSREDLYLFAAEAVPVNDEMLALLDAMTDEQQQLLVKDLNNGRISLGNAIQQTLVGGAAALVLGLALAFIFRANIVGPIRRLTDVAEQIREGDLDAQAQVEAYDETGTLAETFNSMTGRLRGTLEDVRHEKQRADDLLEVVIPIGVELASEKDFNRLLEKMLLEAKEFCHADAGILLLNEDNRLEFVIVRNDSLEMAMGGTSGKDVTFSNLQAPVPLYDPDGKPNENTIATRVALTGQSLNISDAEQVEALGLSGATMFGKGYRAISHLAIPLKNSKDDVIGVMQLINSQDPSSGEVVPFDENLQQMMESFSMLAVAALEAYIREQQLRQEIKQLRVEIDQAKREREVQQIVDDDSFKTIRARAQELRRRRRDKSEDDD